MLGLGIAAFFFGTTVVVLAWITVVVGASVLYWKDTDTNRWMAWTGLCLGIVASLGNASEVFMQDLATRPHSPIAVDVPLDSTATLGIGGQSFSANWAGSKPSPNNTLSEPAKELTRGAVLYEFEDAPVGGSTLWLAEGASSQLELVVLTYDEATTPFTNFMARWDALCRSLNMDRPKRADCSDETMSGLGVSNDPDLSIWQRGFEAEYVYGAQCWQLSVFAPVSKNLRLPTQLRVDAAAGSDSGCRHPGG